MDKVLTGQKRLGGIESGEGRGSEAGESGGTGRAVLPADEAGVGALLGRGESGFTHQIRGRASNRRIEEGFRKKVLQRHEKGYPGFGPTCAGEYTANCGPRSVLNGQGHAWTSITWGYESIFFPLRIGAASLCGRGGVRGRIACDAPPQSSQRGVAAGAARCEVGVGSRVSGEGGGRGAPPLP